MSNIFKMSNIKEDAIFTNNGEVIKAIDFKIQQILEVNMKVVDKVGKTPMQLERTTVELYMKTPMADKTFKDILKNYYFGLFYDGIVYMLTFDYGFYISRKDEIAFIDGVPTKLKNGNYTFTSCYAIKNKNPATNLVEPQYNAIKNEIAEKYYAQMLNVTLLDRGLVVREVLTTPNELTEEKVGQLKKKLNSLFGLKNKASNRSEEGNTLILQGDWNYQTVSTSLADIGNTNIANKCRDYIYNYLGVPPQLMGSETTATYSNYKEAKRNFLTMTVLPDTDTLVNLINSTFLKGKNVMLEVDATNILNFIDEKEKNFNMLSQLKDDGIITSNQLLEESGFGALKGGD